MPSRPGGPIAVRSHLDPKAILAEAIRRQATAKKDTRPPIWTPNPGPQTDALTTEATETYYGGAAGGGKSFWLLGMALLNHTNSIIFRRTYTEMGELIQKMHDILGHDGKFGTYNINDRIWRMKPSPQFPNGQTIQFGAMEHLEDMYRYQGRAHDLKGFDELSSFLEEQYTYVTTWTRTHIPGQRTRICATGNPPTAAQGFWVITRFAPWLDPGHPKPALPGEVRWFAKIKPPDSNDVIEIEEFPKGHPREGEMLDGSKFVYGGREVNSLSRTFYPAKVQDNPFLMSDPNYMAILESKPEPLRSQLLEGVHSVGADDATYQVIPTAWVRAAMDRWKAQGGPAGRPYNELLSAVGVDVARGGRANTVIAKRIGLWFDELKLLPGSSTPDGQAVVDAIVAATEGRRPKTYIDVNGPGNSPHDTLKSMQWPVVGVHSSNRWPYHSRSGDRFINARAGMWWAMRELLDPQYGFLVALPDDRALLAELVSPTYKITSSGIQVEGKEDVMKRLGRSTDRADAVLLAAMEAELPDAKPAAVPYVFRSALPRRFHTTTSALRSLTGKRR